MSLQHAHNTRLTPEKPPRGGRRDGSGRQQKENRNPNAAENLSAVNQQRADEKKQKTDYKQQQDELVNHMGRSWTYHECALILTLTIGINVHDGETPISALPTPSTLIRRRYDNLHALWATWRNERDGHLRPWLRGLSHLSTMPIP
jgi:hypothetical protein